MSFFSSELDKKIRGYLTRYETRRSAILPVLHAVQDELGYISEDSVEALAKEYDLHPVEVREVLTFYSMYRTEKPRPYQILFCDNIVCTMLGAKQAMEKIHHKIEDYESKTGKECPFSLQGVPCLGVCDGAPAVLVNKDRHLKVTEDKIDDLLANYEKI